MSNFDYYSELGVLPTANADEIRKAYRALAMQHHPDKQSAAEVDRATAKLAAVNRAYTVLKDADQRRVYDMQRQAAPTGEFPFEHRAASRSPSVAGVLRRVVLGRRARARFGCLSAVTELSFRNGLWVLRKAAARPLLIFLHLDKSSRCDKAADSFREAAALLEGVVALAALDVEAEYRLAKKFGAAEQELPSVLLLKTDRAGVSQRRIISHPLTADSIAAGVAELLPPLAVCTVESLAQATRQHARHAAALAMRPLPAQLDRAFRLGCAKAGLLCAAVTGRQCALSKAYSGCAGIALLANDGRQRGCVDVSGAADTAAPRQLRHLLDDFSLREQHGIVLRTVVRAAELMRVVADPAWRCASRPARSVLESPVAGFMIRAEALPLWAGLAFVCSFPLQRSWRRKRQRAAQHLRRGTARRL
uniref:J domain-containing protein n=1 Tax=Chrysotila carterae TaxID=13221 RepID=A0A7S4FB46_CHRCT